jgi:hypothetical protein
VRSLRPSSFALLLVISILAPRSLFGEPPPAADLDALPVPLLADLLARASFGHGELERSAFLVRADGEDSACLLWPSNGVRFRAVWVGVVPPGTIAIAHTHPARSPDPSPTDHDVADRLGIPVLVLTVNRISAAIPGSRVPLELLRDSCWTRSRDATLRCDEPTGNPILGGRN